MAKDQDIIKAVKDNDKATLQKLLHKVSKQGKNKIIGNNKKLNVNFQDADGMSALHQAALMSSFQMLQLLLDNGATPGLRDSKGMTALHYSAWQGVPHPVQILLHKGSPVNEQALNGDIPLHLACQHGHLDVTSLLLNHQADPTICNKDLRTSLDLACQFGHTKVVELLLRSNLCQKLLEDSPTDLLDSSRTTCLHLAAKNGHKEIIKLLLQAGMNINRSTQKGTCLHEATLAGKTDVVHFLLDWGADVNKPNARDQTALDTVQKLGSCDSSKELIHLLKEASCAQYARAVKDHSNAYDSGSLEFREGDIITVLEQRPDGIWRGYLYREGRMAKTGLFPAHHVMLVDSKMLVGQQEPIKTGHLHGQVPDLLTRGPSYCSSHSSTSQQCSSSDCGSLESSSTDEATAYSFPPTPSSMFPPPPSAMLASYPPRGPINRDFSGADSGFSSLHSLPQGAPSSPGAHQQFGKCHFAFGPTLSAGSGNPYSHPPSGCGHEHQLKRHQQNHGEGSPAPTSLPPLGGVCGDMRGSSPAKDSPGHSNRNSAASSDSGRGCSTGHSDVKSGHNYVNVQVSTQQNRLSGQSSESGVSSSRQSYHSSSSSSHGSLDPLEEPGFTSTINVTQLFQAGVPDNEVLHAWLHDLHFEEYYPLFVQAGYDLPTISRMTPEDLTAVGITKPAHRKRLKAEIARLNIPDGIPDYRPNDLMEWLHLLGLGDYLDTLCGQGYDSINYVTDITWEDLEDIGIRKLGHQKKIMLAIDRLKRITSGVKHLSLVDGRTASLELLEPPPPAPPITGRWSDGEATAIPMHVYDGARPKKSPSGDSISTTGSGTSGSSAGSGTQSCAGGSTGAGGDIKVISLPLDDVGLAGAIPYRHSSTGSTIGNLQPDIITVQVRKNVRSCTSDDKKESTNGQQLMYHSFQGSPGKVSDSDMFLENYGSRSFEVDGSAYSVTGAGVDDRHKPVAKVIGKPDTESHEKEVHGEGSKMCTNIYAQKYGINNNINNNVNLGVDTREHIYDTPQISQSPKSPKPSDMSKPSSSFLGLAGPLHVSTTSDSSFTGQINLSPGGKSGKKVPPPPPVRTHSIRTETVADRTPASPVKTPVAPAVVTASPVHQHPTSVTTPKQHPPPVMQKPQKPQKPIPAASQPHFQYDARSQQQQHPLSPLVSQKPKSPNPQKVIILPTTSPHLHSPTPGQGTPQMPVFSKPQNTPQQHLQPKSPLLTKVPLTAMVTSVPKQQQQLPHHQPLPQPIHKAHPTTTPQSLGIPQQPRSQVAVSPPHHFVPTSSLPGHSDEPQVKAFANCVKSLSEKFGKNTQEDDQFPDNVSTDSDDFPPPPPPIAMDIITPKIHNYGIPSSRDRRKPEFGLQHHRDYTHKSRPNTAGALSCSPVKGGHLELAQKNMNQSHHAQPSMVVAHTKILPEHLAAVQLRKQPPISSSSSHSSPGTEHEFTPEPDSMNAISKEKRSESTSSFESNSSSSSIDSNTLPFANENVGTIKQRIVTVKPAGGQTVDKENGQRPLEQNSDIFDRGIHRNGAGYSDLYCSSASPSLHSRHRSASMSESSNSSVYSSDLHHQQRTHQRQLSNPSFSGALQPPVPSKKPALSPKPSRSTIEQASLLLSSSSPASEMSQKQEPITDEVQPQMGNVLSDIDNMLQGLTDELDAMLEEEMAS